MSSVFTRIVEDHVNELMRDPATAAAILDELDAMKDGTITTESIEMFLTRHGSFTIADAYVHMKLSAHWFCGAILEVGIMPGIRGGPKRDKDRKGNQRILNTLPAPFQAGFRGGNTQGCDGWFEWTKPIEMHQHVKTRDGEDHVRVVTVGPKVADLEVGSLSGYVMLRHLELGCAIARWPYDSDGITLMMPTKCPEDAPFRLSLPFWRDDPDDDSCDYETQGMLDLH